MNELYPLMAAVRVAGGVEGGGARLVVMVGTREGADVFLTLIHSHASSDQSSGACQWHQRACAEEGKLEWSVTSRR